MLMRITLFSILLLLALTSSAQGYYAIRNDGQIPETYFLDKVYESDKTILLNQPSNQSLSVEASIPFYFKFYESSYTRYKVSENGYITFNTASTTSEIPDTSIPDNSIVVFGKDFKLQKLPAPNDGVATQVFSYTVGSAPNRKHIIQYYGVSLSSNIFDKPITNASIYAFAIVLHEGSEGRFDLIYTPYGSASELGVIGCKSANGTSKTLLNDSLNKLPMQYSFDVSKYIVYQFKIGVQPVYDIVIKNLNLGKIYPVNSIVNFSGTLSNWGKQSIQNFILNYSINQGDTISHSISQVDLLPNGQTVMNFSHPVSWLSGNAGTLNAVNFWISAPNNDTDRNNANSHFNKLVLRNNNSNVDRNILLEEGTGAWCGYCPDAHLIINKAVEIHGSRVIPIAYHSDDSMSNNDGNTFLSNFISSYPDALLDRKVFLGSNSTWLNEINLRLNVKAPVQVFIEMKSFNVQTRTISYRVRVKFSDYWYGAMRIGSIVSENNIRGDANPNNWSQKNFYSKFYGGGGVAGPSHPLYNELEYMTGYFHKHVHKESPGGVWGIDTIIPQLVNPNSEYFADFTYILPDARYVSFDMENNTEYCSTYDEPGYNEGGNIPARISLIGFVAEFDENVFNRPILNAAAEPLWNLSSVHDVNSSSIKLQVYPNPSSGNVELKLQIDQIGDVALSIYNNTGQLIKSDLHNNLLFGENILFLDTNDLQNGVYSIHLMLNGVLTVRNLIISR